MMIKIPEKKAAVLRQSAARQSRQSCELGLTAQAHAASKWWAWILILGVACSTMLSALPAKAAQAHILVVGDSLSAEYGLPRGSGWVALLEQRLRQEKIPARVTNASISGDTTSGGLARLPALLAGHKPSLVIIELGGNDALRGLPTAQTAKNLGDMVSASQRVGAKVLLLGMQVPPNMGASYGQAFTAVYPQVAQAHKAKLLPFFLKNVADVPHSRDLFQSDGIHPVAAAHPIMMSNVWTVLKGMLL